MAKDKNEVQKEIKIENIDKTTTDKMLEEFQDEFENSLSLSDMTLLEGLNESDKVQPVSTELLDDIKRIAPTLTADQVQQLVDYIKGGERPDFVDLMLTQTNGKLNELLKVMSILQLVQLPKLYDYQRALQENLLNPETLKDMTVNELSTEAVNIQKQISEILSTALKINTQTNPDNAIPTKVEKIANQLMGCSEATRNRVIEILEADQQE